MRLALSCWLTAALLTLPAITAQAADKPAEAEEHDFGAKVLLVGYRTTNLRSPTEAQVLVKAKVRRIGDRWFLYGQLVGWTEDKPNEKRWPFWMPLSDLKTITEFDSVDDVVKYYADRDKDQKVKED